MFNAFSYFYNEQMFKTTFRVIISQKYARIGSADVLRD